MKVILAFDLDRHGDRRAVHKELSHRGYRRTASHETLPKTTWWNELPGHTNLTLEARVLRDLFEDLGGRPQRVLLAEVSSSVVAA